MKKYIDADIVNLELKLICDKYNIAYGTPYCLTCEACMENEE